MNTRHQAREWAVQFLFQRDFHREEMETELLHFWADKDPGSPANKEFAVTLIKGVDAHLAELDHTIQRYAEHWDIGRMGGIDRNVMRLALHEMLYRQDIPPVVSINEAVQLAKDFSGEESGKFVNGILDRARKDIDRPPRTTTE